ncbi:oligosaccharide flippase family protein [Blastococcus sp. BMG 814]|uniref:Oligosaccharide flippase family protein n=1 Tax=Blastococcus carthaginiensis TaxID=3050034 RepID=A0ABT9IDX6_9ACTN|nr:oligosaccharide flippase family protein [Blastococcus carthaginiensis]MDP5183788.1 oligosaccharide flippase family protein [Blastococcus carthaginiensis]
MSSPPRPPKERPPADDPAPVEPLPSPDGIPDGTEAEAATAPRYGTGTSRQMRRSQVRGSALLVVGRIVTLLLTTATQVVIVRVLTQSDFGAFSYALALAAAGRTLLSLGQGRLLSRFMAKYEEHQDYDRMFGAVLLAVGTIVVTSLVGLGLFLSFPDQLLNTADPATVQVVLILLLLAPLEALDQVFINIFAVFSAPGAIFFRKYLFTPGLRLAVVVALALTGASVEFLAIGYVAAGLVGLVVSLGVLVRVLRERGLLEKLRPRRLRVPFKAVFSFSTPLLTGELLQLSLVVGGVLVLGYYQSAEEVATYRAVFNPSRLNTAVLGAFVPLFLPLAARLFERRDIDGLRAAYWHTGALVAVLTFPVFALTGPLAHDLTLLLFGPRYSESALVLALLSIGYYFNTALGFNAYTLQVCARLRFLVGVNVSVAVLNIGLSILLVPRYGAVAVAIANLAALVVQNVLNQWALRSSIRTGFIDRSCLRCYLAIVACAATLWVFQWTLRPGLLVGLVAATAASLVVLVVGRRAIELEENFPELGRVPVLRWLLR